MAQSTDSDTTSNKTEQEDQELPFECEWEVGVNEAGDPDDWDWYHPMATNQEEAKQKAKREAEKDGYTNPYVYETAGPFKPEDPIRVGEEMIKKVFGDS